MNAEELKQTTRLLEKLFSCFPQSALANIEMQMRGYLDALKDEALEDIREAVGRFQRGEAASENHQFCPSSAQLSIEVRSRRRMREIIEKRGKGAEQSVVVPMLPANHFLRTYHGAE
jgi:tyrosyl-tRNA synthetase